MLGRLRALAIVFGIGVIAVALGIALRVGAPASPPARQQHNAVTKATVTAVSSAIASELKNRLAGSTSPYLAIAAGSPVAWQPFDAEAFQYAQALNRPVLLDLGGVWCHWCLTMDQESYNDPAIAALINRDFVAVRLDADERPDLERRFQLAARAVAQEAGYPLTLFLDSNGAVFAGGTYFPKNERSGRPGLRDMLTLIATAYRDRPDAVAGKTAELGRWLASAREGARRPGTADVTLVNDLGQALRDGYDPRYGGFGHGAKFPAPQAVDFALRLYQAQHNPQDLAVAIGTLDAMAAGGLRDQLGGAFHRFTLDPEWRQPHFEVIGALNGALAVSFLRAYQSTGGERFRTVAERVLDYLNQVLVDTERGGFYNGRGADFGPGDDGDYYTWTAAQIKAVLPREEAAAALAYYGLRQPTDQGIKFASIAPPRSALYSAQPIATVASDLGIPYDQARATLESARTHLLAARAERVPPPVDRSFLTDRNAALAAAYFEAARILGRSDLRDIALRAVGRLVVLPRRDGLLAHTYAGSEPTSPAMLDDQTMAAGALLDAYAVTNDRAYLTAGEKLLDRAIAMFGDQRNGGFFDVQTDPGPGTVAFRQLQFEDGTILDGNPLAAIVLDRYARFAPDKGYRDLAEATLRSFAGAARPAGLFASGYGLAVDYHLQGQ